MATGEVPVGPSQDGTHDSFELFEITARFTADMVRQNATKPIDLKKPSLDFLEQLDRTAREVLKLMRMIR